jgi:hypothetical protein
MDIYQCSAVVFQSLTNPDEYVLGSYKDGTLTIEIPNPVYDKEDVSIGSMLFQPPTDPNINLYTLNIEWEDISEPLRFFTLEGNTLYLKGFKTSLKSKWRDYDPVISLFHKHTYESIRFNKIRTLLYSVSASILDQIDILPIMDLSIYLSSIHCLLLNQVNPLALQDWYYIKNNLMTIRDNKGLALFYQDCIEDFLNLCDRKIEVLQSLELDGILQIQRSLNKSFEEMIDFIKLK